MEYLTPFRIGKKQKRAVLDARGKEIVIFKVGDEDLAQKVVLLLNQDLRCSTK